MRRSIKLTAVLAVALGVVFAAHHVWAFPDFALKTKAACGACHANPAGGAALTAAGKVYADSSKVAAADAKGAEYVGINKCRMCHIKQYKAWQTTRHAMALEGLSKVDEKAAGEMAAKLSIELTGAAKETDACVGCHVTGFKLAGGYPGADSAKTAAVAFVGCEACHGPGSLHVAAKTPADRKANINGGVTANMCTHCHTPVLTPKFDFDAMKKVGVHVVAAAVPAPEKKK